MAEPLLFLRALGEPPHRVLAYVEHNPVRAGIVAQPAEYEWSSAGVHLGLQPDRLKLIDLAFWRQMGQADGWRTLLNSAPHTPELRLLRRCTDAGRPFEDEPFVESMELRFQRKWRRWGFEQTENATAA